MDSPIKKLSRLDDIYEQHRTCNRCVLHKTRISSIKPVGNENARIVVILDRTVPTAGITGVALSGLDASVVKKLLVNVLGADEELFWFTTVTACQTSAIDDRMELLPAAKAAEIDACKTRIHNEITALQANVIITCGQAATKCVSLPSDAKHDTAIGRVLDGTVQGTYGAYKIPIVPTLSLTQLYRGANDVWNRVAKAFLDALTIDAVLRSAQQEG